MTIYILSATYKGMTTSKQIKARDNFCAKVSAAAVVNASYVSDKRFAKGEITLKNTATNKIVWTISQVKEEVKK